MLDIVIVSVHKRKMVTFGSIGSLPTKEEVIKQVNLRYDELFHYDDNGARQALVCTTERLRSACLLQFPYGVGDLNETRLAEDDSYTEKIDLEKYLNHLTKLSQPIFQKPMF